ncbi:MAG: class I SAM-dependent methyltransferase, partial [Elsteraceae bacterium]
MSTPALSAASAIWWLHSLRNHLAPAPCPVCGGTHRRLLLRRDRYLLPVDISVCETCGCVHCARQLSEADSSFFYSRIYPALMGIGTSRLTNESAAAKAHASYRLRRMRAVIGPLSDILEIGSGFGHFLAACACEGIGPLQGVEPGGASSEAARTREGLAAVISTTPFLQTPPPPFTPRIVAMFHVLEHVADPVATLARVADWIAPDGWLVLEVPDILGDWGKMGVQNFHLSHRSYFSADTLGRLLDQTGFHSVVVERESDDFIYPGNLRIFARRRADAGRAPQPKPDVDAIVQHVR